MILVAVDDELTEPPFLISSKRTYSMILLKSRLETGALRNRSSHPREQCTVVFVQKWTDYEIATIGGTGLPECLLRSAVADNRF